MADNDTHAPPDPDSGRLGTELAGDMTQAPRLSHPRDVLKDEEHSKITMRVADGIARGMGSWAFILFELLVIAAWGAANIYLLARHPFDPFPFVFLNLVLGAQSALAAPIIMMSQNRSDIKDRARDNLEADEIAFMVEETRMIRELNERQMEILIMLKGHIAIDEDAT